MRPTTLGGSRNGTQEASHNEMMCSKPTKPKRLTRYSIVALGGGLAPLVCRKYPGATTPAPLEERHEVGLGCWG